MHDAPVAGDGPEVAFPVGQHVIAESQFGIVLHLRRVVEPHTGQSFNAAAPYGTAHGVFHQLVESAEVAPSLVDVMDTRVMLILGMVEAHDAVFPSAYPEASLAVDQQRRGGVALAQSGIAHHPAAFLVEAEQAALPGSDIQVALGVLGQRVHADRHVDLAKLILAGIITGNAGVCAHPDCSVGRCEKHIDRTGLITMQMVGLKPPLLPVMAHQSVACSYPKAIFLVFCHTAHIIVGQDSRRIGIAPV